ncbi:MULTISPECIES: ROK family protein [unclassified Bacillus cereus group]|uniref:ROK family protein n=1 Tax=unclassified Bacillus cereus group TaxID=2750818 RepID=UPI001F58D618|nr:MULTISPECIES: ROK family protein [unclassified Bacillus cereus group]
MKHYIAVDIGGTQMKYGVVSEAGTVLVHHAVPTEIHLGGEQIVQKVIHLSHHLMKLHNISGIGISTAGIVDIHQGIITGGIDHIPNYAGIPIIERLQNILNVPVSIENDVNCAALGEKWKGAGQQRANFIMLTLGTGVGGAIIIDEKLYRGHSFSAGEWGNMRIEGERFEEVASISGLIRLVKQYKGGGQWDGKKIFELYDKKDKEATQAVQKFLQHLAIGISNLAYIFNPQAIIIGGGVTARGDVFLEEVKKEVKEDMNREFYEQCEIEIAQNGNHAGMIGAIYHLLHSSK